MMAAKVVLCLFPLIVLCLQPRWALARIARESSDKPEASSPMKRTDEPQAEVPTSEESTWDAFASALGVRGHRNFYAQGGVGYHVEEITRNDPGDLKPKGDAKYAFLSNGLLGWGPMRSENFLFYTHYRYSQNWGTDYGQMLRFQENWFDRPKAENFIFPTKSLLRVHEFVGDVRFVRPIWQAGLFTRFSIGAVGSRWLGEPKEYADVVVKTENFVPYVSFRWGKWYRGQLSFPLRTELNKEDIRLNNATYSRTSKGRGYLISADLNNAFYFGALDSLVFMDLFSYDYKYYTIQSDKSRLGGALSIDFPIAWGLRAAPKAIYFRERFVIDRVRIPGFQEFKKGDHSQGNNTPIRLPRREDILTLGLSAYYDFGQNQRFSFDFVQESATSETSELAEFNASRRIIQVGYSYSWPSTPAVWKRVKRFGENSFAEEF